MATTPSRRFDSEEHLAHFKATGAYPRIHDQIAAAIWDEIPRDQPLIDLGSSTGLLTHRLRALGYTVLPIESDPVAVELGKEFRTYPLGTLLLELEVRPNRLRSLRTTLAAWRDQWGRPPCIVARRVFPELYDSLGEDFPTLVDALAETADTIINETRKVSRRTSHPLGTPDRENAALAGPFTLEPRTRVDVFLHRRTCA